MKRLLPQLLLASVLSLVLLGAMGCKSTETENASTRPWNNTEGWSSGFPAGLNEGR